MTKKSEKDGISDGLTSEDFAAVEEFKVVLREKIVAARKAAKISLTAFAKKIGVPKTTYESFEKGANDMTITRLARAAKMLKLNLFNLEEITGHLPEPTQKALLTLDEDSIVNMLMVMEGQKNAIEEQNNKIDGLKGEVAELKGLIQELIQQRKSED